LIVVNSKGLRLLVATTNPNKVREIRQLLAGAAVDLVTLDAWPGIPAPEETGRTFEDNARAKALYYAAATGELTVAEDSGLVIDALDGAPGVESARFGGAGTSYLAKFALIYDALRATGQPGGASFARSPSRRAGAFCSRRAGRSKARLRRRPEGTAASVTIRSSSTRPTTRRSPKPET
jgi:XTP/dITP diphosphohydrolase